MKLHLLIDYIGLYAPIILFILSILFLRNTTKYLSFFVVGFIFNNILNVILKLCIKEPRPTTDQKAIEIGVVNGARIGFDKFGMPSGHAQSAFYCAAFIFLSLKNWKITAFYVIFALLICYQKYIYKEHTLWQLFVGALVGSVMATIAFKCAKTKKMGILFSKPEDGAPY